MDSKMLNSSQLRLENTWNGDTVFKGRDETHSDSENDDEKSLRKQRNRHSSDQPRTRGGGGPCITNGNTNTVFNISLLDPNITIRPPKTSFGQSVSYYRSKQEAAANLVMDRNLSRDKMFDRPVQLPVRVIVPRKYRPTIEEMNSSCLDHMTKMLIERMHCPPPTSKDFCSVVTARMKLKWKTDPALQNGSVDIKDAVAQTVAQCYHEESLGVNHSISRHQKQSYYHRKKKISKKKKKDNHIINDGKYSDQMSKSLPKITTTASSATALSVSTRYREVSIRIHGEFIYSDCPSDLNNKLIINHRGVRRECNAVAIFRFWQMGVPIYYTCPTSAYRSIRNTHIGNGWSSILLLDYANDRRNGHRIHCSLDDARKGQGFCNSSSITENMRDDMCEKSIQRQVFRDESVVLIRNIRAEIDAELDSIGFSDKNHLDTKVENNNVEELLISEGCVSLKSSIGSPSIPAPTLLGASPTMSNIEINSASSQSIFVTPDISSSGSANSKGLTTVLSKTGVSEGISHRDKTQTILRKRLLEMVSFADDNLNVVPQINNKRCRNDDSAETFGHNGKRRRLEPLSAHQWLSLIGQISSYITVYIYKQYSKTNERPSRLSSPSPRLSSPSRLSSLPSRLSPSPRPSLSHLDAHNETHIRKEDHHRYKEDHHHYKEVHHHYKEDHHSDDDNSPPLNMVLPYGINTLREIVYEVYTELNSSLIHQEDHTTDIGITIDYTEWKRMPVSSRDLCVCVAVMMISHIVISDTIGRRIREIVKDILWMSPDTTTRRLHDRLLRTIAMAYAEQIHSEYRSLTVKSSVHLPKNKNKRRTDTITKKKKKLNDFPSSHKTGKRS